MVLQQLKRFQFCRVTDQKFYLTLIGCCVSKHKHTAWLEILSILLATILQEFLWFTDIPIWTGSKAPDTWLVFKCWSWIYCSQTFIFFRYLIAWFQCHSGFAIYCKRSLLFLCQKITSEPYPVSNSAGIWCKIDF